MSCCFFVFLLLLITSYQPAFSGINPLGALRLMVEAKVLLETVLPLVWSDYTCSQEDGPYER
jgi:hypothetical protein